MKYEVLFLIPPLKSIIEHDDHPAYKRRYPHLGIAYMAAVLKQNGIEYRILDMNLGYSTHQLLAVFEHSQPNLVCITVYSAGYKKVYSLIEFIKSHYDGLIVVGGPHISVTTKESLNTTPADFAVIGEGEYALLELIGELNNSNPNFEKISALIWRQGSKIIMNDKRIYINDLDSLPFPAFEDFELEKYLCYVDKRLPIITSRGCPYKCNYCCTPLSMGKKFRKRGPENVVDEIEYWYKKGWATFDFNDDVFSLDKKRAKDICDLIVKRGIDIKFNLYVGLRVDNVDIDLLQSLKASGCRFISYGCESGSERILKIIRKGIRVSDVISAVNTTKEVGIKCKVNFIIGHSTETYQDALESIKLAKNLKSDFVGFNNIVPYPGTPAYEWIKNNKNARFLCSPEVYLNELTHKRPIVTFETDEFKVDAREKLLKKGLNLEKRTLACFRFGKYKGYFVYLLTRNRWISKMTNYLFRVFTSTRIGCDVYRVIIKQPW